MSHEWRALREPLIHGGDPRNPSRKRGAPMSESSDASDDGVADGESAGEGGMGREAESSLSAPFVTPMGRGSAQGADDPASHPTSHPTPLHIRFDDISSGAEEDSEGGDSAVAGLLGGALERQGASGMAPESEAPLDGAGSEDEIGRAHV